MNSIRMLALFACCVLLAVACVAQDFATGLKAYENQDFATAYKEWQPLAQNGGAAAQFNLGLLYYDGHGVARNAAQAAQWFERAANQGYAKAQYNLGEMYATGKGVHRDYVQSFKWLSLCAESGNETCAAHRDLVSKKLHGAQLDNAQRITREWKPRSRS